MWHITLTFHKEGVLRHFMILYFQYKQQFLKCFHWRQFCKLLVQELGKQSEILFLAIFRYYYVIEIKKTDKLI